MRLRALPLNIYIDFSRFLLKEYNNRNVFILIEIYRLVPYLNFDLLRLITRESPNPWLSVHVSVILSHEHARWPRAAAGPPWIASAAVLGAPSKMYI